MPGRAPTWPPMWRSQRHVHNGSGFGGVCSPACCDRTAASIKLLSSSRLPAMLVVVRLGMSTSPRRLLLPAGGGGR
jgi:hypothetical protein